ncbi:micronuclear linker histone polyprotein-like [Asbolus verrucosus]|uniref:Micronuclear linker histone polyprotein-like n=1 Tax=Asbolus verrucosus TaxID=1661398 RepID=A0A482WB54_ASBVE|nr:micronuclear linker histone polyprotein-like [Asbolus verrucosus]
MSSAVDEVDGAIQIPHLEQPIDRKICAANKPNAQVMSADCAGALRISNEGKKVDENGNALHQNLVKTKKKKVLTDKNVVVCNAENVKGHRSDIINDMDKLMEFIGITDDQSEKNNRSIKSKQLNRHSSDDTSKSKKRAHSSKSKDNRSKLKKSNSLGEISTTNLDDFEFDKDKVVMRNGKNGTDKPRERRSWGNMEPLPIQNLYSNASAENLESAEFRVVTKKKKSKKRRSSVSGRTKTSSNPTGKGSARGPSPDLRRKSACSVPHSEKSNDSSDVDSVHSLPIDTQRLDLATSRLNMPISYADMAKNNDRPKEKKLNDKVPKEPPTDNVRSVSNQTVTCDRINSLDSVKNTPPDVHNIKNFPAITKQVQVNVDKTKNSNKTSRNPNGANKNVKNNVNKSALCVVEHQNNIQNDFAQGPHEDGEVQYSSSLPPDIPDVQTIEKMQLMGQGHPPSNCYDSGPMKNGNDCGSVDCDISERTSVDVRPPVVILSGFGNSKEVPGLVFGFDINEQLLSEDGGDFCCEDFISRYVAPETYTTTSHNHDKIVNFIGAAWEEAVVNLSNGKVQYYSDLL